MKKALKTIICLFIMVVAFGCFNGFVSAEDTETVKIYGRLKEISGIRSKDPSKDTTMMLKTLGSENGPLVYCLNSGAHSPNEWVNGKRLPNPMEYKLGYSNDSMLERIQNKIPGIIAVIKNSTDLKKNDGASLSLDEQYFVTQFVLWEKIEGVKNSNSGEKVTGATSNAVTWIKGSNYSNAYNFLISCYDNAQSSENSFDPQLTIVSKNGGALTDTMSEVNGTTLKMSDTVFTANFTGTSNNEQDYKVTLPYSNGTDRSYITDESGKANYHNEHVFKAGEGFRIVIDTSYAGEAVNKVNVPFNVYGTEKETKDVLKTYYAVNNQFDLQEVALVESTEVSLSESYKVITDIIHTEKYELFIKKVNKKGDALSGAELSIYNEDTRELVTTIKSGNDSVKLELAAGKYYVKEIKAPNGYILTEEEIHFSIDDNGAVKGADNNVIVNKTITIVNNLPTITLRKVNDKMVDIKGAKIEIWTFDETTNKEVKRVFEWLSDGTTKEVTFDFDKIGDGSYVIKEVSAPKGFIKSDEIKKVYVKDGKLYGDLENGTATFVNKVVLEVSKTDATGQKELDGAKMTLKDKNGSVKENWTSSSKETHKIKGLEIGEVYEIVENAAPEGYFPISTSIKFRITNDGKVETLDCNSTNNGIDVASCKVMSTEDILKIKNDVTKLKISKIDVTNEKELPGAVLQILHEDGTPVYQDGKLLEWRSESKPHEITMLPVGKYKLVETFSPEGYVAVSNEVIFEVKATGEVQTVQFKNDVTKVMISKKDFTTGEEIEGATLQIKNDKGEVIHEWKSEKEPHYIEKLPVGTYTLVETLPAGGYAEGMYIDGALTTSYTFEVKDNILLKIDVYNKTMSVPITGIDVSSTYVIGGSAMAIGFGTIVFARKKREA